jgi:hypothetical protein
MTIPVNFIFNPNWWYRNYGLSFTESFYLDKRVRIENDVRMRRALFERFGWGEPDPQPRPILGSAQVAGGFVLPALFGLHICFSAAEAPTPVASCLNKNQVLALEPPDIETTGPVSDLIEQAVELVEEYGWVCGDFDVDGILNIALQIRGQELFVDLVEDPNLARHFFSVVTQTIRAVADRVRSLTGTCSVATNRSILAVDPRLFLHSNCSLQMISPALYRELLFPFECDLATHFRPYGIHHCGNNLHLFADAYAQLNPEFVDVGWGSDLYACRRLLPNAFLNLRLSPVRMLQNTPDTVRGDVEEMLAKVQSTERTGLCCINMDYRTPDANVLAVVKMAESV